jgi:hypothetical protein
MATITAFVVELVRSVVDLVIIFATDVATQDPIALLVFLTGAAITTLAAGFLGLLVAGVTIDVLRDSVS